MKPSPRQREAMLLRCAGLTYAEVGQAMGICRVTAGLLARAAASKLIRTKGPSEADRKLAFEHFPKIAAKYASKKD